MKNDTKVKLPSKVRHFLTPDKFVEDLSNEVKEYTNYASYDLSMNANCRSVLTALRDVPSMIEDPICASAVKCIMQTVFQTDNKNRIFTTSCVNNQIKEELDKFHAEINADNFLLVDGYNCLLWGQLPWKHCFNKEGVLERVIPIPDFTAITPVILSGSIVGYLDENGEFVPSYEYTYSQLSFYKNLGGNTTNMKLTVGNEMQEFRNEFTYANSYLSAASKPWRNINIIEDALLLARMDQSNYYRIISVNVGGQVYSKSAVTVLNYYRNLFKKVRRVNYDSSGMASRGNNQEFEVIVPANTNQSVSVQNVGGDVDVKALKDLDTQYQKLFAALQIQPSMIGFSDEMPSSLGEGPATAWDKRFAKVCKTVAFAAFDALRNIDYLHLRSLGYNVERDDWSYNTVSQTIQEDSDKGETLKLAVENLKNISETLDSMQCQYDKVYLVKNLLSGALSNFGVDVEQLTKLPEEQESTQILTSLDKDHGVNESFKKSILEHDSHIMALSGLMSENAAEEITSAFVSENFKSLDIREDILPMTLKQLNSSIAVKKETPLILDDIVLKLDLSSDEIQEKFSKAVIEQGAGLEFRFPIFCPKDIEITVGDMDIASSKCIRDIYVDKQGNQYLTNKTDIVTYINNYINGNLDNYCNNIWRSK